MATPLTQETIRRKRDGLALRAAEVQAFVRGITDGRITEAQLGAFAMAVRLRGMTTAETVALTLAMRDSGQVLAWQAEALSGPVVDKHSTGGIGDCVSLVLGPLLAACGCFVPMISGRGLGHTGGTLDKLEAIPGYCVQPDGALLRRVVQQAGIAIIGAGKRLAPADQRLYAVRDVTATVDSLPLITASILSKKLAAGLQALVLDVKFGNGAFMPDLLQAGALAQSLVDVGCSAGLPTEALLTDMNQALAPVAGNALETAWVVGQLTGRPAAGSEVTVSDRGDARRFREVVLALGTNLLQQAGRADDPTEATQMLVQAWDRGAAAERFGRMVALLGGPSDLLERPWHHLPRAAISRPVPALDGARQVVAIDTRALGMVVVALGGGRQRADEVIDLSVGLSRLAPLGTRDSTDAPLAWVHARNETDAAAAIAAVQAAYRLGDHAPVIGPVVRAGVLNSGAAPPSL